MVAVLHAFGFGATGVSPDLFLKPNQVVRLGNPPLRIEILTTISGVDFADYYVNRIVDTIDEIDMNIINLNDLRINKQASGRLKDLTDLENLPKQP